MSFTLNLVQCFKFDRAQRFSPLIVSNRQAAATAAAAAPPPLPLRPFPPYRAIHLSVHPLALMVSHPSGQLDKLRPVTSYGT